MTRLIVLAVTASVALSAGFALSDDRGTDQLGGVREARNQSIAAPQQPSSATRIEPGTRKFVGEVAFRGRKLRLETAVTTGGGECLIDVEGHDEIMGSTCFDGGLFDDRKVVFSVNFDGGPERFRSLYVVGIAAPGIASIALTRTDGSITRRELGRNRTFVFDSTSSDLDRNALPADLEAFGPSGRRVERVELPALR